MSRTDAGKVGLVAATGFTAWVVLFNIKLAFELFVCAVVLDQVGSRCGPAGRGPPFSLLRVAILSPWPYNGKCPGTLGSLWSHPSEFLGQCVLLDRLFDECCEM